MSRYVVIGGRRGNGMYLAAVLKSARENITIGVPNERTKQRLMELAKEAGVQIPEPVVMLRQRAEALKGVTLAGVIIDKELEENAMNHTMNKGKAMLSQPMAGKTQEEIVATREKAIKVLQKQGYQVVNTLFTDEWYSKEAMESRGVVQIPLCFLAKSLENMSLCHAAYFCKGWEKARGCKIEHDAAVAYGLDIIYEE